MVRFSFEQCIDNCFIILRDEEPSSNIAFALTSKDYQQQLESLESRVSQENETELTDFNESKESQFERILKLKAPGHINYGN